MQSADGDCWTVRLWLDLSDFVQLYYPIDKMGIMYKILKDQDIEEIQNFYGEKPYLAFYLRKSVSKLTIKKISTYVC